MEDTQTQHSRRGFAAMDPEQQRSIARKGGMMAQQRGTAHRFSSEEAQRAGQKGGKAVSQDRHHMAEIGRKGGQSRVARQTPQPVQAMPVYGMPAPHVRERQTYQQ